MTLETTYCRLCDSRCGLKAEVVDNRLVSLRPDEDDPVGAGFICDTAAESISAMADATRITEPMKRVGGHLKPVGWDQAIEEIGGQLRRIRSAAGPNAIGLYLGQSVQRSTRTLVRSLAFGVGAGTRTSSGFGGALAALVRRVRNEFAGWRCSILAELKQIKARPASVL